MKRSRKIGLALLCLWGGMMLWHSNKPLPQGVRTDSASVLLPESSISFLTDLTYQSPQGQLRHEQQIFDAVLRQIDAAENFVVLDYFLINDDMVAAGKSLRPLSNELAEHLLRRKQQRPQLQVLLITDPINDVYGGAPSPLLARLQNAGIAVVRTNLAALRDSNPGYSALWRLGVQWWSPDATDAAQHGAKGWLPNPFASAGDTDAARISLASWLHLLNFKANHRKVIVSDTAEGQWWATVASANPHDGSSAHSNVALQFRGEVAQDMLRSELNVARMSGWQGVLQGVDATPTPATTSQDFANVELAFVTESAIKSHALRELASASANDRVQLAMFYLSDRDIVAALVAAATRGASVQLILDPNKDAFGLEKDGVPNRPVAHELVNDSQGRIEVRWYRTHGEQFHTKLLMIDHDGQRFVTLGSANFTRRNLDDYNLEANVTLRMPSDVALAQQFNQYFERLWNGDASNPEYTAPFAAYDDDSKARYWRYRIMEATGLSTF